MNLKRGNNHNWIRLDNNSLRVYRTFSLIKIRSVEGGLVQVAKVTVLFDLVTNHIWKENLYHI